MWCSSVAERWTWKLKVSGSNPGKSTSFSHSHTCNIWLSMYNVWHVVVTCDMWLWHVICEMWLWYVICGCDMWYEICDSDLSNLLILRCYFFRLFPSWTRLSLYRPIYLVHDPYDRYKTSKIRKVEPVDPSFTTCNVDYTILQTDQSTMVPDGYHLWSW